MTIMEEDHERANAREWDQEMPVDEPRGILDEWNVVGPAGTRKRTNGQPSQHRHGSKNGRVRVPVNSLPAANARATENRSAGQHHQVLSSPGRSLAKWQGRNAHQPMAQTANRRVETFLGVAEGPDDSEAQTAWRKGKNPEAKFRIPYDLLFDSHTRRPKNTHETIAKEHGTVIANGERAGPTLSFGIYGPPQAVQATVTSLEMWIESWRTQVKSAGTGKFHKDVSLTPALRERAEKEWKREIKRQKFRQALPLGKTFAALGTFYWPVSECRPEEALGLSFEAIDPIRMDCSAYISFMPQCNAFRVASPDHQKVLKALTALKQTYFQIVAGRMPATRKYLLHFPKGTTAPLHVYLEPYAEPALQSGKFAKERPVVNGPRARGSSKVEVDNQPGEDELLQSIMRTLGRLHFHRGPLEMSINFGRFLATSYLALEDQGGYKYKEFESMIQQPQFVGHVTQEIGDEKVESAALDRLRNASEKLLMPLEATHTSLSETRATYSALFLFEENARYVRLFVEWQETDMSTDEAPEFDVVRRRWTRVDRSTESSHPLLDANLIDLSAGSGWHFGISGAHTVDESRLAQPYVDFYNNMEFNAKSAQRQVSTHPFVNCKSYVIKLKSIEQRLTYRFGIQGLPQTLELFRFQKFVRRGQSSDGTSVVLSEPQVHKPRWGLSVSSPDWDRMFAENENMRIGGCATWSEDVREWFADHVGGKEGQGFHDLMVKLEKIARVVQGA